MSTTAPAFKWNPHDAVLITRGAPDRRIIYVNRAFCRLTGFAIEDLIGENGDLLLTEGALRTDEPQWMHTAANGRDVQWVARLRRRDGSDFWAEALFNAICDDAGHITHYVIVINDVSEQYDAASVA